jgi:hypothetical protein
MDSDIQGMGPEWPVRNGFCPCPWVGYGSGPCLEERPVMNGCSHALGRVRSSGQSGMDAVMVLCRVWYAKLLSEVHQVLVV